MEQKGEVVLQGLFPGKGQSLEDLIPLNKNLTPEEIEEKLKYLVSQKDVEPYSSGGQNFYLRSV